MYAGLASASAVVFVVLFFGALDGDFWARGGVNVSLLAMAIPVYISAHVFWSDEPIRGRVDMVRIGLLTVGLSFVLLGVGVSVLLILNHIGDVMDGKDALSIEGVLLYVVSPILYLAFGSLFTLGIPYALGAMLSLLFVTQED